VANAIENAIGVRFTELPVDAAAVRAALQAQGR
jgi:CO/xanthine dehydrogenase Mo-binding subunit